MNFIPMLLTVCAASVSGVYSHRRVRRFYSGASVKPEQFPYMVSLESSNDGSFCGGSIIQKDLILTSAHCVENRTIDEMFIVAGTATQGTWRMIYFIEKIFTHYDDKNKTHGIALIKLKESLKFSEYIQKIHLNSHEPPIGESMTFSGWGLHYTYPLHGSTLQYSKVTSISHGECKRRLKKIKNGHVIDKKHICTYDKPYRGFCSDEFGGPLVYNGKQVGIGIYCATGYPDVYVKISSYIAWIEATKAKLRKESKKSKN